MQNNNQNKIVYSTEIPAEVKKLFTDYYDMRNDHPYKKYAFLKFAQACEKINKGAIEIAKQLIESL